MKRTLIFALSLMLLAIFAVGCTTDDNTATGNDTTSQGMVDTNDDGGSDELTDDPSTDDTDMNPSVEAPTEGAPAVIPSADAPEMPTTTGAIQG